MLLITAGASQKLNRLGVLLVGFAFAAVVLAYPPSATGLEPLLGAGNMFLPLIASVASLLIAVIGGFFLARGLIGAKSNRSQRLLVRILIPVLAAAVIGAYLVVVAGFSPQSSFIIGAEVLAIAAGIADEFTS